MKYIVTDSIRSVNRLLRRQNYAGKSTFGVEAVTALGLAWPMVIERTSAAGLADIRMINSNTASAIVLELMLQGHQLSFVPEESLSLATAREVLDNMNLIRANLSPAAVPASAGMGTGSDSYSNSASADVALTHAEEARVRELRTFIGIYEETLCSRGFYDAIRAVREAVDILKQDPSLAPDAKIEICYYNKPSVLEKEFVGLLHSALKKEFADRLPLASEQKFESLLHSAGEFQKQTAKAASYRFIKAYGITNEVDTVAQMIIEENIPLGDVEILCDPGIYAPYIKECFAKRCLDYTFTCSVNGAGFHLIQMMKGLLDWVNDCRYEDLFGVMHNPLYVFPLADGPARASEAYLKGISYGIGWGADRYFHAQPSVYDRQNQVTEGDYYKAFREVELPALGELAKAIQNAVSPVAVLDALTDYANAHKYANHPENRYTTGALLNLRKSIAAVGLAFEDRRDLYEYLQNELSSISYSEMERYDAASISSIHTRQCIERKHIFVLGLSAKEFKISTAESPVLGDRLRRKLFGDLPAGNVTLAENAIAEAEQTVCSLLRSAPDGSVMVLLSSSADTLRDCSEVAASALFEKLCEEKGCTAEYRDRYSDITTYPVRIPREKAWAGYGVRWPAAQPVYDLRYSKSSLDSFLGCPLAAHYDRELHINKEEFKDYDPGAWLAANERGTLVHRILELYCETLKENTCVAEKFDEACPAFISAVATAVREADALFAAPSLAVRQAEIDQCVSMVKAYLAVLHKDLHDNGWVVMCCEEKLDPAIGGFSFNGNGDALGLTFDPAFHIHFTGSVDRIDYRLTDGEKVYRIADYKTGRYKNPGEQKTETKQHLIYADYVEKKFGGKVETFDYLFLKALQKGDPAWVTSFDRAALSEEIVASAPPASKGKVTNPKTTSEQDVFSHVYAGHDYTYSEKTEKEKGCRYCRYKDICLFRLTGNGGK